jgi:hypothetical protein
MRIMQQPIIIPMETKRDCIEVRGKLYCEVTDPSARDLGFFIIIVLAILLYGGFLWWLEAECDVNSLAVWGFGVLAPLGIFAVYLIVS